VKLAILGGSFNPVHIGHLFLADEVLSSLGYDRVILVPAFKSPFKVDSSEVSPMASPTASLMASPKDRVEMLAASISGDPRLTIDDCELSREGISYTIETLIDIIDRYMPEGKPGLILGDDLVSNFDKWEKPDDIAELADFIIARREEKTLLSNFPYPYRALNNEVMNVSSRQIREKIAKGDAWRYLVPSGARYIIEGRGLYGFGNNSAEENEEITGKIAQIENDMRASLDLNRFFHSRNVALLAWDLCRRFGIDPQKGYLAGIAHDMCKNFDAEKLIRLARADGGNITKLEQGKPGLLHARAAAIMVRKKYGITDKDILEAIRYHTTGTWDMGTLAKIVYVADKLDVSRVDIAPALKTKCRGEPHSDDDLENIFAAVLNNTVSHLRHRHLDISYGTRRLLTAMQRRKNSEKSKK
jgi:nicotinate-nucleotide adenylyltransferase